jgi:hypothetical protein
MRSLTASRVTRLAAVRSLASELHASGGSLAACALGG